MNHPVHTTPLTHDRLVHITTARSHMTTPHSSMANQFSQPHLGSNVIILFTCEPPRSHMTPYTHKSRSHDHIPFTRRRDHPINTWPPTGLLTYLHVTSGYDTEKMFRPVSITMPYILKAIKNASFVCVMFR